MKAQFKQETILTDATFQTIINRLGLFTEIKKPELIEIEGEWWQVYEVDELPPKAISPDDLNYILQSPDATFEDAKLYIQIDKSILDNEFTVITSEDEEGVITETSLSYRDYFQYIDGVTKAILRLSDHVKDNNGGIDCFCSEGTLVEVMTKTGSVDVLTQKGRDKEVKTSSEYAIE